MVHPNGFGPQSYARWQPKTGLADSDGTSGDFSMLLVHLTPLTITATARAVVAIEGFDGEHVTPAGMEVSGLEFYVRITDPTTGLPTTECTVTSPRFSIRWRLPSGTEGFAELHCANALEMAPGSIMTATNGSMYQQRTATLLGLMMVPPTAIIISLAILWDGSGSSHIDNISVTDMNLGCTPCTWTRPADNGAN